MKPLIRTFTIGINRGLVTEVKHALVMLRMLLNFDLSANTEQDKTDLAWSLDALWALMWAGNLFETMEFWSPIPNSMYELCPHIRDGDGPEKFASKMKIRSFDEIYRTLDLYYRLHWYAFQNQIRDELGVFDLSRFIERRKALEWLVSPNLGCRRY